MLYALLLGIVLGLKCIEGRNGPYVAPKSGGGGGGGGSTRSRSSSPRPQTHTSTTPNPYMDTDGIYSRHAIKFSVPENPGRSQEYQEYKTVTNQEMEQRDKNGPAHVYWAIKDFNKAVEIDGSIKARLGEPAGQNTGQYWPNPVIRVSAEPQKALKGYASSKLDQQDFSGYSIIDIDVDCVESITEYNIRLYMVNGIPEFLHLTWNIEDNNAYTKFQDRHTMDKFLSEPPSLDPTSYLFKIPKNCYKEDKVNDSDMQQVIQELRKEKQSDYRQPYTANANVIDRAAQPSRTRSGTSSKLRGGFLTRIGTRRRLEIQQDVKPVPLFNGKNRERLNKLRFG